MFYVRDVFFPFSRAIILDEYKLSGCLANGVHKMVKMQHKKETIMAAQCDKMNKKPIIAMYKTTIGIH
jgi:hypothetical protein